MAKPFASRRPKLKETDMRKHIFAAMAPAVLLLATPAAQAQSQADLAFMPSTATVTLLNEGGKYVAVDLKHIDQGGKCRMDESATIMRIGPGTSAGTTRVRYVAPQLSPGGCPFLTEFEMPSDQFALARKSFEDKKEQAENKIADLKKQLGDKWDEALGRKN
jgi:hypothetical protein